MMEDALSGETTGSAEMLPNRVDFSLGVIRELLYATLEALVTNDLTSYTGSPNYSPIRKVIAGYSNGWLASWLAVRGCRDKVSITIRWQLICHTWSCKDL